MDRLSIITLAAAKAYANKKVEALEQVVRYIGVTTTEITDGSTTNPITINGQSVTAVAGDTVFYNGTSYAWDGSAWQEVMNIAEIITAVEALGGKVHDILADIAPTFDSATTYAVDDVVLYEDDLYIFTAEHTGAWDSADVDVTSLANIIEDIRTELSDKQDALPLTFSGNDITTNGSLFAGNDIQDGQGNTLSVLAEALTKTASGNPITISDCAGGKARSLKTTIEAIQDLHGYDHPWAGGAGKNKFDITEISDVGNSYKTKEFILKANETYTISTDLPKNNNNSANLFFYLSSGSPDTSVNGVWSGQTRTLTTGADGKFIIGYRTTDYTDPSAAWYLSHKIQVEEGSTATAYAPYSNICPISGRTEARVDTENEDSTESAYAVIQLGQTVYGADINWDTGVMTVNRKTISLSGDSTGSIVWEAFTLAVADGKDLTDAPAKCSHLVRIANLDMYNSIGTDNYNTAFSTASSGGTGQMIRLRNRLLSAQTAEAYKAWFADELTKGTPMQVCYELAEPQTIQLTATQLEMLKGYNRVSIESGTITLDYIAKAISGNDEEIAPLVGDKATKSYSVNDFIERADGLYRVTASIASGASFTANNTVKMSIGEALTYLYNK